MWLFQSLETYTGVICQTSIDGSLYRADRWLFGVEPTVWLSRHSTPLVTDSMALAHGSYFVTPMILATTRSLRSRREDFREMCTAVVIVDRFAGLAVGAVSIYLAPILRMRWPKLAH
jgi:hypothetical protein